jgi:hypothetical protein
MDTHEIRSLVIPLMVDLDLTILGMLVAVFLGLAWVSIVACRRWGVSQPPHRPSTP